MPSPRMQPFLLRQVMQSESKMADSARNHLRRNDENCHLFPCLVICGKGSRNWAKGQLTSPVGLKWNCFWTKKHPTTKSEKWPTSYCVHRDEVHKWERKEERQHGFLGHKQSHLQCKLAGASFGWGDSVWDSGLVLDQLFDSDEHDVFAQHSATRLLPSQSNYPALPKAVMIDLNTEWQVLRGDLPLPHPAYPVCCCAH